MDWHTKCSRNHEGTNHGVPVSQQGVNAMSEQMIVTSISEAVAHNTHRQIVGTDELGRKVHWDVPADTFASFTAGGGRVGSKVSIHDDGSFVVTNTEPAGVPDTPTHAPEGASAEVPTAPAKQGTGGGKAVGTTHKKSKPRRPPAAKPKAKKHEPASR